MQLTHEIRKNDLLKTWIETRFENEHDQQIAWETWAFIVDSQKNIRKFTYAAMQQFESAMFTLKDAENLMRGQIIFRETEGR